MNKLQLNPWNWFKHEDADNAPAKHPGTAPGAENKIGGTSANHPMLLLQREIDRLFDDTFRDFNFPTLNSRWPKDGFFNVTAFQAKLNVASDDKNYHISLEAPGLTEKDISLDVTKGVLTIRGEKKEESETKDKHYYRVERSFGSFQRVLTLPDDCDQDAIAATMKNGLLEIAIPRKALPASDSKRIAINSNNS